MATAIRLALCALLILAGCGRDPATSRDVSLVRTDREAYQPGDLILVEIRNTSDRTILYHCAGVDGEHPVWGWNGSYGMSTCASIRESPRARRLLPRSAVRDTLHVNACAYSGRWRVTAEMTDENGHALAPEQTISPVFHVTGGWDPTTTPAADARRVCVSRRQ